MTGWMIQTNRPYDFLPLTFAKSEADCWNNFLLQSNDKPDNPFQWVEKQKSAGYYAVKIIITQPAERA